MNSFGSCPSWGFQGPERGPPFLLPWENLLSPTAAEWVRVRGDTLKLGLLDPVSLPAYCNTVEAFVAFSLSVAVFPPSPGAALLFLLSLTLLSAGTLASKLAHLQSTFPDCRTDPGTKRLIVKRLAINVANPPRPRPEDVLDVRAVRRALLTSSSLLSPVQLQERALLAMIYATGSRPKDLSRLRVLSAALNSATGIITIAWGVMKNRPQAGSQSLPGLSVLHLLRVYLRTVFPVQSAMTPLFPILNVKEPSGVVRRLMVRLSIPGTAKTFRRHLITVALEQGFSLAQIMAVTHHASEAGVLAYVQAAPLQLGVVQAVLVQ